MLNRLKTLDRGKPEIIGMVAMDGSTGFIKAMAGFNPGNPATNPCTATIFPAASLFKIVTASAAVEKLNCTATTPLYFSGRKYTLYKRQLTQQTKYTSQVSLETAFSESINPVVITSYSIHYTKLYDFEQTCLFRSCRSECVCWFGLPGQRSWWSVNERVDQRIWVKRNMDFAGWYSYNFV